MNKPRVVLPGIIIGAVVLALAVVFVVLLPKSHGDKDLTLPDTLPGGYVASDLRAAYADNKELSATDQAQYVSSQVTTKAFAAKAFTSVGVKGTSRNYITKDGQGFVAVQLIRAEGGALSPFLFADPKTAQQGQQLDHFVKAGDATCIETGTADGAGKVQQSVIECQKSKDGLTLQVTTQAPVATVSKLITAIWTKVA